MASSWGLSWLTSWLDSWGATEDAPASEEIICSLELVISASSAGLSLASSAANLAITKSDIEIQIGCS